MIDEKLKKWRLILGKDADTEGVPKLDLEDAPQSDFGFNEQEQGMDETLEALYGGDADRKGGLGKSTPFMNRWLGDIRKYFPTPMVQVMQRDALERLDLNQMLLQPELLESLQPDIHLATTILSLNKAMPDQTRETARLVVRKVVEELEKKLNQPLREAIRGALSRAVRNRHPRRNEIDWDKTIRANLKHYQTDLQTIIPETLVGRGRRGQSLRHVILLVDESGSMSTSVVYASVFGAVMASLRAIKTQMVVFDTEVVDLTAHLNDPVELLFCTQLGGGTDITKALHFTEGVISNPSDTILILISDLFEGGNSEIMFDKMLEIKESGVTIIILLALSDEGKPVYDKHNAARFAAMNLPVFACTPDKFSELMAAAINRQDLSAIYK
ncbi:MAG: VWA domain-containing protein [Saprospiraceae bacterium]|nr:VWA domain-containing protein [Saprospiraceae bacterium]